MTHSMKHSDGGRTMRPTRRLMLFAGTAFLLTDLYGMALWGSGPKRVMEHYDKVAATTRATGKSPCDVCGRPGRLFTTMTTGAGGTRSNSGAICADHVSNMLYVGQGSLSRFAMGLVAIGGAVLALAEALRRQQTTATTAAWTKTLRTACMCQAVFWCGCLLLDLLT